MPGYVVLANYIPEGLKAIKGAPGRIDETWGWAKVMVGR